MVKFSDYFLVAVSPGNRIMGYIFLVGPSHSRRKLVLSSSYGRIGNKEHNTKRRLHVIMGCITSRSF
ncbi:hypothetical protein MKW98_006079 [Papaver atlanticum]|uniref:Uncharacterized protein n=1 Tax=Papaver atlanticum TaxID=357466 RepID=A0AAD4XWP5_9MAGN|nr:hypothetical protein MKW98_006079 [Papaver atlanticum]